MSRRPQAVRRISGQYALHSSEHATWHEALEATIGALLLVVGFIAVVFLLALLGYK